MRTYKGQFLYVVYIMPKLQTGKSLSAHAGGEIKINLTEENT